MSELLIRIKLRASLSKRRISHGLFGALIWCFKGSGVPSPNYIKWRTLESKFIRNSICIETGTYLGETTKRLSKKYPKVISLEPNETLFNFTKGRFKNRDKIQILKGQSQDFLSEVLKSIDEGSSVNFWLDGHFSGGITFKGEMNTPIVEELATIKSQIIRFSQVVIAIDDFRDFKFNRENDYPTRAWLVEWSNKNGFEFDCRNDIFFMEKRGRFK